jgi:hypothetical protein
MRGVDLAEMIIAILLVGGIILGVVLPRILGDILKVENQPNPFESIEVETWVNLIREDLVNSKQIPKTASTPVISFTTGKDTVKLGQELGEELKNYINMTKMLCCECEAEPPNEWRVCESESCTQSEGVIDVINPDEGIFEQNSYVITVTADNNFKWLCIDVELEGESE